MFSGGAISSGGGDPLARENEATKEWLGRYRELSQDIDHLEQRLETLRSRLENPGAANLDAMPRASSFECDMIGQQLAVISDLEKELREVLGQRWSVRQEIEQAVRQIQGRGAADRKAVLRLRYVDCAEWGDINFFLFGGKVDFADRADSYLRRTFRLHSAALVEMTEILKQSGQLPEEGEKSK